MSRIRIFLLVASVAALATALAACGGGGGGSEDAQSVIDNATLEGVESGVIDAKVKVGGSGDLTLSLSGPFQSGPSQSLPELDLSVKADGTGASGESINFEGGLTLLGDRAFVNYKNTEYEVDPTTFGFVKSGFEQAAQQGGQQSGGSNACQKAAQGIEVGDFVDNLKSEGGADVDGTATTKVSGDLNVEGGIDALLKLGESPACASQIEAAGQGSLSQLESVKGLLGDAIKEAHAEVYVGDDNIIRKLVADFAAEESGEKVTIEVEITLSGVNEDQSIKAPPNAQPLEALFQKLGVDPLELLESLNGSGGSPPDLNGLLEGLAGGGGSAGGSAEAPPAESQAYLECLQGVETPADLQKCANLAQ